MRACFVFVLFLSSVCKRKRVDCSGMFFSRVVLLACVEHVPQSMFLLVSGQFLWVHASLYGALAKCVCWVIKGCC